MKKNIYRMALSGIMLFIVGGSFYYLYARCYINYNFVLHFDFLFSHHVRNEITTWFNQVYSSCSLQQIVTKLQKKFVCVKSVRYIYKSQGMYEIFVGCHVPCIVLNSSSVITDHALIAPYNYFVSDYLKELPRVTSKDTYTETPVHLCRMLLSISPLIFQKYSIELHDQNTILLENQSQKCIILADKDSLNNIQKIEKAYQIFSTRNNKKSSNKNYMYDIRFNNQILESVVKGKMG